MSSSYKEPKAVGTVQATGAPASVGIWQEHPALPKGRDQGDQTYCFSEENRYPGLHVKSPNFSSILFFYSSHLYGNVIVMSNISQCLIIFGPHITGVRHLVRSNGQSLRLGAL